MIIIIIIIIIKIIKLILTADKSLYFKEYLRKKLVLLTISCQ